MLTRAQQAVYRPLVARAWAWHCWLHGRDPGDLADRKSWYRGIVRLAIGRDSTRDACPDRDFVLLMHAFAPVGPPLPRLRRVAGWTAAQNDWFHEAITSAYLQALRRNPGERDIEAWVAALLADCGLVGFEAPDKVESFDRVMAALAVESGDTRLIAHFSEAAERRLRHLIARAMQRLGEEIGRGVTWDYIRGILSHMGLPVVLEEVPALWLRRVLAALHIHLRRLRKAREPAPF